MTAVTREGDGQLAVQAGLFSQLAEAGLLDASGTRQPVCDEMMTKLAP